MLIGGWTNPFEKYGQVKMGSSSPIFGVNMKQMFELNNHPATHNTNLRAAQPVAIM